MVVLGRPPTLTSGSGWSKSYIMGMSLLRLIMK